MHRRRRVVGGRHRHVDRPVHRRDAGHGNGLVVQDHAAHVHGVAAVIDRKRSAGGADAEALGIFHIEGEGSTGDQDVLEQESTLGVDDPEIGLAAPGVAHAAACRGVHAVGLVHRAGHVRHRRQDEVRDHVLAFPGQRARGGSANAARQIKGLDREVPDRYVNELEPSVELGIARIGVRRGVLEAHGIHGHGQTGNRG